MITATVNEAVRAAQVPMSEEWISEEELIRQFQMFSKSGLRDYGKYLPQAKFTYRDRHGVVTIPSGSALSCNTPPTANGMSDTGASRIAAGTLRLLR